MRDEQLRRNLLVGHPRCHQPEHLSLPLGQLRCGLTIDPFDRRLVVQPPELAEDQAGQARRKHRSAVGRATHRFEELLAACRLDEVSRRARLDR